MAPARILCLSPIVMASHMAAQLEKITIAVLGPIIPLSNPVRVEEFTVWVFPAITADMPAIDARYVAARRPLRA
jgi:hypothetical protein